MLRIDFLRHGPKNKHHPHKSGFEATLAIDAKKQILDWSKEIDLSSFETPPNIIIYTSPVKRAFETSMVVYNQLSSQKGLSVSKPIIEPEISSYDYLNEKIINLSPPKMSQLWAEAKSSEDESAQKENASLLSWCKVGFDNNWNNSGLTQREISGRILSCLTDIILTNRQQNSYIIIFGHSGDIEPFIYYLLGKENGVKIGQEGYMEEMFYKTDGALPPLKGLSLRLQQDDLSLYYPRNGKIAKTMINSSLLLNPQPSQ